MMDPKIVKNIFYPSYHYFAGIPYRQFSSGNKEKYKIMEDYQGNTSKKEEYLDSDWIVLEKQ